MKILSRDFRWTFYTLNNSKKSATPTFLHKLKISKTNPPTALVISVHNASKWENWMEETFLCCIYIALRFSLKISFILRVWSPVHVVKSVSNFECHKCTWLSIRTSARIQDHRTCSQPIPIEPNNVCTSRLFQFSLALEMRWNANWTLCSVNIFWLAEKFILHLGIVLWFNS